MRRPSHHRPLLWLLIAGLVSLLAGPPARAQPADLQPPELLEAVEPNYPPALKDRGVRGTVVLELALDVQGRVTGVQVVEGAGPDLDAAAVEAARKLRFSPAMAKGKPVPVRLRYRFDFVPDAVTARRGPAGSQGRFDRRTEAAAPQGFSSLEGTLREKGTGLPLGGIVVRIEKLDVEVLSDADGHYRFGLLPPGKLVLRVPAVEHKPVRYAIEIAKGKTLRVDLRLERERYGLYRATAEAPPPAGTTTRRHLAADEIQRVPGVYGDALKVVQNLPGVARPSPLGGEIVVRGSAPSDTLVAVEGVPVPLLYHFGGLYSVFNTDLLEGVDFLPGGYPVAWGRHLGGVLDARLKIPTENERFAGYLESNAFHTGLYLQGSVGKSTTVALAGRRSYVDWLLNAVAGDALPFTVAPRYYDWQAKVDHVVDARTSWTAFAFGSDDAIALVVDQPVGTNLETTGGLKFSTYFMGLVGILRHDAQAWSSRTTLGTIWGGQSFELGRFLRFDADAVDLNLRQAFSFGRGPLQVRTGVDVQQTVFWADVVTPKGRASEEGPGGESAAPERKVAFDDSFHFGSPAAWYDVVLRPSPRWEIVPGLRLDGYLGEGTGLTLSPKVAIRHVLDDDLVLKGATGLMSQRPQPFQVLSLGGLGTPDLAMQRGLEVVAGAEWQATADDSIDAQVFYKHLWDLAVPTPGLFPATPYQSSGRGRVVGFELMARHKLSRNWFGWLAYTLQRAERRDLPGGEWRLFDWDQTHILTAVASYKLPNHWEIGARFRLASGNTYTPVATAVWNEATDGYEDVRSAKVGSARLPAFHQLDVRVDKRWVYDRWMLSVYLDLQNVYNRQNPEGLLYSHDYTRVEYQSGLPILPSLGAKIEF